MHGLLCAYGSGQIVKRMNHTQLVSAFSTLVHPKWQKICPLASSSATQTPRRFCARTTFNPSLARRRTREQLTEITSANREAPSPGGAAAAAEQEGGGGCKSKLRGGGTGSKWSPFCCCCRRLWWSSEHRLQLQWWSLSEYISSIAKRSSCCCCRESRVYFRKTYVHYENVQFHWNPSSSSPSLHSYGLAPAAVTLFFSSSYPSPPSSLVAMPGAAVATAARPFEKLNQSRNGAHSLINTIQ